MSTQPVFAVKRFAALLLAMSFVVATTQLSAQQTPAPPPPPLPPPGQALTPDQLDDLVAPIALYPDELVSQIMVAATYPLEVVEAAQFVQANPNLKDDLLGSLFLSQLAAVGITLLLSVAGTTIIAFALKFAMGGLRPSAEVETAGLDISEHGEEAYIS